MSTCEWDTTASVIALDRRWQFEDPKSDVPVQRLSWFSPMQSRDSTQERPRASDKFGMPKK